jgi:hypothetical protein
MKTSELTGAALDWAVEEIENPEPTYYIDDQGLQWEKKYSPSTDWAQGGPIIEREGITVSVGSPVVGLEWMACDKGCTHIQHGTTYLISAMRCLVASKLGDEVEIPEELTA